LFKTRKRQKTSWLKLPASGSGDPAVKPLVYLPIYERLMEPLRHRSFTLLELGVWNGQSLEMWRDAFPHAMVIGIDLLPPQGLELGPRVHIVQGDQSDASLMARVRNELAPAGFDVVIDDASHIGVVSAASLKALYVEHLRPGGLYCIEDWGTGYLLNWRDGGPLVAPVDVARLDEVPSAPRDGEDAPVSMPSHDLGMVGLVKRLVEHTASGSVRAAQPAAMHASLAIESMTIWDGVVALRKPASGG
jgi:SAM-dependent methyltransferase